MTVTSDKIKMAAAEAAVQIMQYHENELEKRRLDPDLRTFNHTGKFGEICAFFAAKIQILQNHGVITGYTITAKHGSDQFFNQVQVDRLNGDLMIVDWGTGLNEHMDVKNKEWIGRKSLNEFRKTKNDGLIFMNAFYKPTVEDFQNGAKAPIRFIVSCCEEFKDYIRTTPTSTRWSGEEGYSVMYKDMKPEWLYPHFDQGAYDIFLGLVWSYLVDFGIDPKYLK